MSTFERDIINGDGANLNQHEITVLCEDLASDAYEREKWLHDFSDFSESVTRIMYHDVTTFIYGADNDKAYVMRDRLNIVYGALQEKINDTKANTNNEWLGYFIRFYDHCMLAIAQKELYQKSSDVIDKKMEEAGKSITGQLIGLVSLFSALAFLVFGGINLLSSLIELADTRYAADMLSAGCVWLWAMGNIFLLFVHFMLIISGKSKDFKLKWYIITINAIPAAIFLIVQILDNLNWI